MQALEKLTAAVVRGLDRLRVRVSPHPKPNPKPKPKPKPSPHPDQVREAKTRVHPDYIRFLLACSVPLRASAILRTVARDTESGQEGPQP